MVVRKRPLNSKERERKDQDMIEVFDEKELVVQEQKVKVDLTKYTEEHSFIFDNAYDIDITNL